MNINNTMNMKGFTLLELSIVLIIVGLLMSMTLPIVNHYASHNSYKKTKSRLVEVNKAISVYFHVENKLPCPASMNSGKGKRYSNRSVDCEKILELESYKEGITKDGIFISKAGNDEIVLTGYVPVYDLGIPEVNSTDAWNRKIKYSVSLDLTNYRLYDQFSGHINLENLHKENINWDLGKAQYALVSHGKRDCQKGLSDYQNCKDYSTVLVSKINESEENYYDDLVLYKNYIDTQGLLSNQECSVSEYLKRKNVNQNRISKDVAEEIIFPRGELLICNQEILQKIKVDTSQCITLTCINGRLENRQLIIE